MCKDQQENRINIIKFHEETYQVIEQFKGQIIRIFNTFLTQKR